MEDTGINIKEESMTLQEAQQEVRAVFLGGTIGQLVTGAIWLFSAALGTWVSENLGIITLFFGGMLIFPLTQLLLRLAGKNGNLSRSNSLNRYALQSVFAMGAMYPLIYAATLHNINWFYPAFMMVVGAHYISFIFLYGMWQYGLLGTVLIGSGITLMFIQSPFYVGGWISGIALLLFVFSIWKKVAWKQ